MVKLPEKVDLSDDSIVFDQGELGSATACAVVACMEYMLKHPQEAEFIYYEVRPLSS